MKEKSKQILVDKDMDENGNKIYGFGYGLEFDDIIVFIIGTLFIYPQLLVIPLYVIYLFY